MKNQKIYIIVVISVCVSILLMTWGVVSFIRNEGDIMMKVPTNPDNIKIREETIKLTGVMLGGCISILSALVAILTTIITNFFSNQKSVH